MFTLYARKLENKDVIVSLYPDFRLAKAIFPFLTSSPPDRRNKYVMLNCCKFKLKWI